jgi:hypothetical protein
MPTGKFHIGELKIEVQGGIEELIDCQETQKQINKAEKRLREASGNQQIEVVRGNSGEAKASIYLVAKTGDAFFTINLERDEESLLGVKVGESSTFEVHERKPKESEKRTAKEKERRDSSSFDGSDRIGGHSKRPRRRPNMGEPSEKPIGEMSAGEAREDIVKRANVEPDKSTPIEEISINRGNVKTLMQRYVTEICGRDGRYMNRVAALFEVDDFGRLPLEDLDEALKLFESEKDLREREQETFEPDDSFGAF